METCFYMFEEKKNKIKMLYIQNNYVQKGEAMISITHLDIHIDCSRNSSLKITKLHDLIYSKLTMLESNFQ